jgi:hypothetical protein
MMKKNLISGFLTVAILFFVLSSSAFSSVTGEVSVDPVVPEFQPSETLPSESDQLLETAEVPEDIPGESLENQTESELSDPDKGVEVTERPEDIREALWAIPPELEADYEAVTGGGGEAWIYQRQFDNEGQNWEPRFHVTLPGAPRTPLVLYDPLKKAEMPDTLLNGEAPMYEGGKILRNEIFGTNHSIEIEVPATPEEIFNYYKAIMTAKGWQNGMSMREKEGGFLFFSKPEQELVFRIAGRGQCSRVIINMVGKQNY